MPEVRVESSPCIFGRGGSGMQMLCNPYSPRVHLSLIRTAINQFAAHVGLDWADNKHDACVLFKSNERVFHVIEHTAEVLDVWNTELHQKVIGRLAIAVELKKGHVVFALRKSVYHQFPCPLARYRQAFSPSGAKDDP